SALTLFLFVSCKKDDNSTSSISTTTVTNTIVSGTWKITYYWDTDHEETASFSGYNFAFGSGNILTATKTSSSVTGTWTTLLDDSEIKLVLGFSTPTSFIEISDDWHVIERTDTRIKLQHISGGNGGTDYLTFEKN
ncbi:MAG TPA: hypothetical protein VIY47_05185, partial [Ignavibacteriaceae bacterium]